MSVDVTYLLWLASSPQVPAEPLHYVSWEKRCDRYPAKWRDDCMALTLSGLPLRCQERDAEDEHTIAALQAQLRTSS